jgi:hypothetical protein
LQDAFTLFSMSEEGEQNGANGKTAEENAAFFINTVKESVEEAKEDVGSHRESESEQENEDEKDRSSSKQSKRAGKNAIHPCLQKKKPKDDEVLK